MDDLNTDTLPKGKEPVELMMKWKIIDKELFGCAVENTLKYNAPTVVITKKRQLEHGWNNYTSHYTACVGTSNIADLLLVREQ